MKKSALKKLIREILEEQVQIKKQPRPHRTGPHIKRPTNKPATPKHSPNVGLGGVPPMPKRGGGPDPIGKYPGRGPKRGCMDPEAVNFCDDCLNDCANNPAGGVQTGLFGWNWSVNNDDLGDTSCCDYSDSNCADPDACNYNPAAGGFWNWLNQNCSYCFNNDCTLYPSDEFDCNGNMIQG